MGGGSSAWVDVLGGTPADVGGQPRRNTKLGAFTTEAASKKTKTWVRWMTPDTALRCAPGLLALLLAAVVVVGRHDPDSNQIFKRAARRG